jgi:hypothetical protein
MTRRIAVLMFIAWPAWSADDAVRPPIAGNPVVDVKGTIEKVQIVPGQGMPFLDVNTPKGQVKVFLGSMRYLMQENFNPKAGEPVEARGYRLDDTRVVGIRVELPASKKTLRLRDEHGWPLWMGGRRGPMAK